MLMEKVSSINKDISDLLIECAYKKNYNLDMISYDKSSADECMLYDELSSLFTHLDFIHSLMTYLQKPITEEGVISITKGGKYKLNKIRLDRKDLIEILIYSEDIKAYMWQPIYVKERKDLTGQKARIRKK